jgi:hypothetical protein
MKIRLWLLLSLSVSAITWLYATRVLVPWNDYLGKHSGLKAQMWDLYPRWVGTRELLLRRRNPYGPEVSHEIQMAFYGHIVTQDLSDTNHKPVDEQRFAYPVYVVFLMAPTMFSDFGKVSQWAPLVLGLLAAVCVPLSVDLLRWRLPWSVTAAITLFTVCSPQITQGMRHQQLSIIVGLSLVGGAWCVSRNHLAWAGAVLAWSTVKPQMAFFPLCFFLIWVLGDWCKRWRLMVSFLATLGILIGAGELILPGWIGYFAEAALAYRRYLPTTSVLRVALGDTLGEILGTIILAGLLMFAWRNRRATASSPQFITVFCAFLIGTILGFPLFIPFNQVMLILPSILILEGWNTLPKFSRLVFVVCIVWPWVISLVLLWFRPQLDSPNELPLLPLLLVSFYPLVLPLLLMTRGTKPVSQPTAVTPA